MIRGASTDAGEPNCGSTLSVPLISPFCRKLMVPLPVRTSHTTFELVRL